MNTNGYALLGLLMEEPMSGYMMKRIIDLNFSHFWKTSYGQIYPTMSKFIEKGLVTVSTVESDKGPASKFYAITDDGKEIFRKWLYIDAEDFNTRDESLLKFYFSNLMAIDEVIERFKRARVYNQSIKAEYEKNRKVMLEVTKPTRKQLITYLSVQKGVHLNEARLMWIDEVLDTLKWFKEEGLDDVK